MKKCRKCNLLKSKCSFYFRNDSNRLRNDCKDCVNKRTSAHGREKGYDRASRNRHYRNRYNITVEQYDKMLRDHRGLCAICNNVNNCYTKKSLHVDHCHEVNEVRGLLCHNCNTGLGNFRDSLEILEKAAAYLINFQEYKKACQKFDNEVKYTKEEDNHE